MSTQNPTYVIIDTETSGLWPHRHGLIEFAAAVVSEDLRLLDTLAFDVCPPENTEIDPVSLKINKFTEQRIKNGVSYSVACTKITDFLNIHFSLRSPIFVGQFYPFDYAFLVDMYVAAGRVQELEGFMSNKFVDTKSTALMANAAARYAGKTEPFPSTSLSSPGGLKDTLGVGTHEAHTALGDVLMTYEVLVKLIQRG